MLIPFQDALKPYANLKLQHRGLVVKVDDPLNLGRVKCKVEGLLESSDIPRLPWCYPKESTSRGGRADSGTTAVPPLYSMVLVEFPAGGDAPVGGGSPYYPVWVGMARMDLSNPGIGSSVGWSEDSDLPTPYGTGTTTAADIETNVWVKTQSQNVAWTRTDKSRGSWEFYDQDSGTAIRIDRGGHVQMQVATLDVVASSDIRLKSGGNFHVETAGDILLNAKQDIGIQTAQHFGVQAESNIDMRASGSIGMQSQGTFGVSANGDFGVQCNGSSTIQSAGSITLNTEGSLAMVAGGTISERGAVCARDAGSITDNGGGSSGPLSSPPAPLGTIGAILTNLGGAQNTMGGRVQALSSIVGAMGNEASSLKSKGQSVLNTIKGWANNLVGTSI